MRVSHARRPGVASDGRTIGARRRIAKVLPTLTMSVLDATPALRRLVAPHRVTVAEVRTRFCHSRKAPTTANRTRSHVGEERITDHPNRAAAAPHPTATAAASAAPHDPCGGGEDEEEDDGGQVHGRGLRCAR